MIASGGMASCNQSLERTRGEVGICASYGCTRNTGRADNGYASDISCLDSGSRNGLTTNSSSNTDARGKEARATNSEVSRDSVIASSCMASCNQSLERTRGEVSICASYGCTRNSSGANNSYTSNS